MSDEPSTKPSERTSEATSMERQMALDLAARAVEDANTIDALGALVESAQTHMARLAAVLDSAQPFPDEGLEERATKARTGAAEWLVGVMSMSADRSLSLGSDDICEAPSGYHDDGDPMLCSLPEGHASDHTHHDDFTWAPGTLATDEERQVSDDPMSSEPDDASTETCGRCGGPNAVRPWAAPSPLWNLVMRGNDINGDAIHGDLVCIPCFIECAADSGLEGMWRLTLDPMPSDLITITPSGRIWDEVTWTWTGPTPADESTAKIKRKGAA